MTELTMLRFAEIGLLSLAVVQGILLGVLVRGFKTTNKIQKGCHEILDRYQKKLEDLGELPSKRSYPRDF